MRDPMVTCKVLPGEVREDRPVVLGYGVEAPPGSEVLIPLDDALSHWFHGEVEIIDLIWPDVPPRVWAWMHPPMALEDANRHLKDTVRLTVLMAGVGDPHYPEQARLMWNELDGFLRALQRLHMSPGYEGHYRKAFAMVDRILRELTGGKDHGGSCDS